MTKQRALILRLIQKSNQHLTADELYRLAQEELPGIALATVYNSLQYLAEQGLIRRLTRTGQRDRYDRSVAPHAHLVCDHCGAVADCPSEGLREVLEQQLGVPVDSYELAIGYRCPVCRGSEKN